MSPPPRSPDHRQDGADQGRSATRPAPAATTSSAASSATSPPSAAAPGRATAETVAGLGSESWASVLTPRLAQFAAVARHEHITRAAHELGVPQSSLSRAMVRLEADLAVSLLARRGRAVSLTPAGRAFARSVERALGEVERAAEGVRTDADPAAGKVAFGFLHTMGPETVPALIREFRAQHPRVRFSLVQSYGEDMIERMREGELDLCLTSPVPDAPDLVTRRLARQRLRLVLPVEHRLAHRKRIRLAEAAEDSFVMLEPGYGLRRLTEHLCREAGFAPRVAFEGEEAETLRGLVAAGLGVALLPPPTVPRPGVREIAVTAPAAVREIGVAWMAGHADTRPVADFKSFLLSRREQVLAGEHGAALSEESVSE